MMERLLGCNRLPTAEARFGNLEKLAAQHHTAMRRPRSSQERIRAFISGLRKKYVENHRGGAALPEPTQQLCVQSTIPSAAWLPEIPLGLLIHLYQHDVRRHRAGAKKEERVIAEMIQSKSETRREERHARQRHQRSAKNLATPVSCLPRTSLAPRLAHG